LDAAGEKCYDGSAFDRWLNADSDDTETRRKAATRIVEVISAWEPKDEALGAVKDMEKEA
jgi:hypothetical protein